MSNETGLAHTDDDDLEEFGDDSGEYTVAILLAMSDDDFDSALSEDLHVTTQWRSLFMDPAVIRRSELALLRTLERVDGSIRAQAEDPDCSAERYRRSISFRRLILFALTAVEHQSASLGGGGHRAMRSWRSLVNRMADLLEGGPHDHVLDELKTPLFSNSGDSRLTVRQFVEIRRLKDPARVPLKEAA